MNNNVKNDFNDLTDERSDKADSLHQLFLKMGIDFVTGVPCGVLKHIISNFAKEKKVFHLPANRESEAVGIAAGAYLAGKIPLVYMQNSGLFTASNDIASLLVPYRLPIFFVVTYRGCEGEDAVQHLTTGGATESLLMSFNLTYKVYKQGDLLTLVTGLHRDMLSEKLPVFLLLKRGWQK